MTAYDPQGTGDPASTTRDAPKATDDNGDDYWETERYSDAPSLGKPGSGSCSTRAGDVQLHQLGIATATPGFTAEIKAGDSQDGPFPDVVAGSQVVGRPGAVHDREAAAHRYYLIWITRARRRLQHGARSTRSARPEL